MRIGRNEPCPCGSGRKYKKCCLAKESIPGLEVNRSRPSPRFRFGPGSYGGPGRCYVPSILCYEQSSPGKWSEDFVLAKPSEPHDGEDEAVRSAAKDLNMAYTVKQEGGSDAEFAFRLKDIGYVKVKGFRIASE